MIALEAPAARGTLFDAYRQLTAVVLAVCEREGVEPANLRLDVDTDTYVGPVNDSTAVPLAGDVAILVYGHGRPEERIPRDLDDARRLAVAFGVDTSGEPDDNGETVSWSMDRSLPADAYFWAGFPVLVSVYCTSPAKLTPTAA